MNNLSNNHKKSRLKIFYEATDTTISIIMSTFHKMWKILTKYSIYIIESHFKY